MQGKWHQSRGKEHDLTKPGSAADEASSLLAVTARRAGIAVSPAGLSRAASILAEALADWRRLFDDVTVDAGPWDAPEGRDAMD